MKGLLPDDTKNADNTSPEVTLTSIADDPTNVSPIDVEAVFDEAVTGLLEGEISVTNGSVDAWSLTTADDITYNFTITPSASGVTVSVQIPAGAAQDDALNDNTASNVLTRYFDNTSPEVTLTSTAPDPTNVSPIDVEALFDEAVTGLLEGEISVTNGSVDNSSLTTADNITYNFTVTPSASGVTVSVQIPGGAAHDDTINDNTASNVLIRYFDNTSPEVTLTSTASDPTNVSPIDVEAVFDEAVTGLLEGGISVTNGSVDDSSLTTSDNITYNFTVTPSASGVTVSVQIPADAAQDDALNDNTASNVLTWDFDNTSPEVTLTSTAPDPTNVSPIDVKAVFDEAVTGLLEDEISVTNGAVNGGSLSTTDYITYNFSVTPSANGVTVSVQIPAGVAQDDAINDNTASNILTRDYDSTSPCVMLASTAADPTNVSPINVEAVFDEAVTGLLEDVISVTNGAVNGGSLSTTDYITYNFSVTPSANGVTVSVQIPAGAAQDDAINDNNASNILTRNYNSASPCVMLTSTAADPTNVSPIIVEAVFDEAVSGLLEGEISVTNGAVNGGSLWTTDDRTYNFMVTPSANNVTVSVQIPAGVAQDGAFNVNTASNVLTRYYDAAAPAGYTVSYAQAFVDSSNETAISFTFAGAEIGAEYYYSIDDTNVTTLAVSDSGTIITGADNISPIDVSSLDDGTLTLTAYLVDASNNQGPDATDTITKDTTDSCEYHGILTVDNSGTVGNYTSIAVNGCNIYIAYFSNNTLKFQKSTDGGETWLGTPVDVDTTAAIVGEYCSIDVVSDRDADGDDIYISYYYNSTMDLRFAKSTNGGISFTISNVLTANNYGMYSSIAVVPDATDHTNDHVYISHEYDQTGGGSEDRVQLEVSAGGGGAGTWTDIQADYFNNKDLGMYAVVADSADRGSDGDDIYISHYADEDGYLRCMRSENGGATWSGGNIDIAGNVGTWSSIALSPHAADPAQDIVYISYYDSGYSKLKFARSTNGASTFSTATIDNNAGVGTYSSIAAGGSNVYISYRNDNAQNLMFIKSTNQGSNFGSPVIVDNRPNVGLATSIAEHENNIYISYVDNGNGNLKFAKSNDYGDTWDNILIPSGYYYHRPIVINHNLVGLDNVGTLPATGFPVLISLSGDWLKTTAADPVNGRVENSNGWDIVFTASEGGSALYHQVEDYDGTAGTLTAWVRIDSLSKAVDTTIYIYYGSPGVSSSTERPANVWDSNFQGLWHMEEQVTDEQVSAGIHSDSTGNGNNGTQYYNGPIAGKITGGQEFDGTADYISNGTGMNSQIGAANAVTVSAWVRHYNLTNMKIERYVDLYDYIVIRHDGPVGLGQLHFYIRTGGLSQHLRVNSVLTNNTWYHVVGTWDGTTQRLYLNGQERISQTPVGTLDTPAGNAKISNGAETMNGIIDEVRVSRTARSADWIVTEYNNQSDTSTGAGKFILSLGAEL